MTDQKENVVSPESFYRWKKDPVTQEVFKMLLEIRQFIEVDMLNPTIVLGEGGLIAYSKAAGIREGIDRVLNIEIEDITEENNEQ